MIIAKIKTRHDLLTIEKLERYQDNYKSLSDDEIIIPDFVTNQLSKDFINCINLNEIYNINNNFIEDDFKKWIIGSTDSAMSHTGIINYIIYKILKNIIMNDNNIANDKINHIELSLTVNDCITEMNDIAKNILLLTSKEYKNKNDVMNTIKPMNTITAKIIVNILKQLPDLMELYYNEKIEI